MTNFLDWLYFHYILPAIEEADPGEYQDSLNHLEKTLTIGQQIDMNRAVEFYASNAFMLGLRTGIAVQGALEEEGYSQASFGSTQPSI